jgi:hypothetical protein
MKTMKTMYKKITATLFLLMFASSAWAVDDDTGLVGVLTRLKNLFKVSGEALVIFGYVGGLFMLVVCFLMFKRLDASSSPGEQPAKASGIVFSFVAGIGLLYLGSVAQTGGETFFSAPSSAESTNDLGILGNGG